ncbi:hypothetical protein JOF53_007967 [Crossiella equi]|uniref:Uncharacterized protein n=1 Tax=Crossiella equi TaxID=130796 RepID=A0ABS5ATT0_9PSEU|nr:hypothetical protein [Crossiella equi]MBP2479095.1 hypothetical protein [Crossiella equi]
MPAHEDTYYDDEHPPETEVSPHAAHEDEDPGALMGQEVHA